MFGKNQNAWEKHKFWSKIKMFAKNQNFWSKIRMLGKNQFFGKKS